MNEKTRIIEAALFMSDKPLNLDYLGKTSGVNSLGNVREILEGLQKDYDKRGMEVIKTPHGWVMQVKQDLLDKVAHLTPYYDLSEGCKRTLAIVAYMEPVKQSEIIRIQGNKAYSYIKSLTKKELVKTEKTGHTKILKLTAEFERYFGEEKEKVKEQLKEMIKLPKPEKPKKEEVEKEAKTIEAKMEKMEKMFEVPEELRTNIKEDKPEIKMRKPRKRNGKRIEPERQKRDMKASHTDAFNEID